MAYKSDKIVIDDAFMSEFDDFILKSKPFYPSLLEIFLTDTCNHNCNFCTSADYRVHKRNMPITIFEKTVIDAVNGGTNSLRFSGGGEPLLHPEIKKILSFCLQNNILFNITTNGHFIKDNLKDSLISTSKEIRISVDAGDAATYSKAHGVNANAFDKLIENIQQLIKSRGSSELPIIELSFVVTNDNFSSLSEFIKISNELNVDRINITMNTHDDIHKQEENLLNVKSLLKGISFQVRPPVYFHDSPPDEFVENCYLPCPAIILTGLIDTRGFYYPSCHHIRHPQFIFGKLNETTSLAHVLSSGYFRQKQLEYAFKPGTKLKKALSKLSNVILTDRILKSPELKKIAASYTE